MDLTTPKPNLSPHNPQRMMPYTLNIYLDTFIFINCMTGDQQRNNKESQKHRNYNILTLFSKILKSFSHSFTFLNGVIRNLRFGMKSHNMQLSLPSFSIWLHIRPKIHCNRNSSGWVCQTEKELSNNQSN